jgi:hypothetical protein
MKLAEVYGLYLFLGGQYSSKISSSCQAWWYMPVIPVFRRLR